ncbi:hypothetical protein MPSEU_000718900 [Mayamaea pseudoterrestris]|nr:hypothetical protein MPSEU_000718900 [Mayamaea pseudoterrestris]
MTSRRPRFAVHALVNVLAICTGPLFAQAFVPAFNRKATPFFVLQKVTHRSRETTTFLSAVDDDTSESGLRRVPVALEGVPIPYVDVPGNAFIECYADSMAKINGVEYTIGVPCDYAVALCYNNKENQIVPIELDDEIMEDVFPIAEGIVAEEFGEELVLQRTPQTLTLVGELDDKTDDEDADLSLDDDEAASEEVEVLLSFEHRGKEYNLVRLLDPLLLVGKIDSSMPDNRVLLSPEEADAVMPALESLFLEFHDGPDSLL